ncbi:hypothetical protein [Rubrivivax gelatinosus]|uniref:Uncharacterized protein n=1 Tax=Rubrivivax gelatinosus TaxID=28068 RepID=A0A4V2SH33_RUBGE|nr:hypothetical protein [Rubrivivax gelatinosus]MBK1689103.1 hypothetical protein [Rubrivivax gelatinosus]TCP03538.1 hypothetical protein EV684_104261 [Rubrivivax gelatinosus]
MPFAALQPRHPPCTRLVRPAIGCARAAGGELAPVIDADIRRAALAVLALTATVWWPSAPAAAGRLQSLASFTRSDSRA